MKKEIRKQIYQKFDGRCAYCGELICYENMQVDHIHPVYRKGIGHIDNLHTACRSCNATKATYTVEEFRKRLIDDVFRLERDSSKFRILVRFGIIDQIKDRVVFYYEQI